MENPVQPSSQEDNHISFSEGSVTTDGEGTMEERRERAHHQPEEVGSGHVNRQPSEGLILI